MPTFVFAAEELVQTITYDGRLYNSAGTAPLADPSVVFKFQIYDPTATCLLYEEVQSGVNLSTSNGVFSLKVGSKISGGGKRTANDPGLSMSDVFQNAFAVTSPVAVCPGGSYTPATGHARKLRVTVTPSSVGSPQVLSPDIDITGVPSALVCETLQGKGPNQFLQIIGGTMTGNITMSSSAELRFSDGTKYIGFKTPASVTAGSSFVWTLPAQDGTNGQVLQTNGSGALSWVNNGGAGAGVNSLNGLSGVLSIAAGTTGSDVNIAAAGSTVTVHVPDASNTARGAVTTGAQTFAGAKTFNAGIIVATQNTISLGDNDGTPHYVKHRAPANMTADYTLTWPAAVGALNDVLKTDASGNLSWAADSGLTSESDPQVGANTTNYLSKWDGSALVASGIIESGGNVGVGVSSPAALLSVGANANTSPSAAEVFFLTQVNRNGATRIGLKNADAGASAHVTYSAYNGGTGEAAYGVTGTGWTPAAGLVANEAFFVSTGAASFNLQTNDAKPIRISTNSSERMRIDSAGNVGIGLTGPSTKLHVAGTITSAPAGGGNPGLQVDGANAGLKLDRADAASIYATILHSTSGYVTIDKNLYVNGGIYGNTSYGPSSTLFTVGYGTHSHLVTAGAGATDNAVVVDTAGAHAGRLLSLKNNGVEKSYFGGDGSATFTGSVTAASFSSSALSNGTYQKSCTKTFNVNTATPATLTDCAGANFAVNRQYSLRAWVSGTTTQTGAAAYVRSDGTNFELIKTYEAGTANNHVEFYLDANVPKVRLYSHATLYDVHVSIEELHNSAVTNRGNPFGGPVIYQNASSVGIGTTGPNAKLDISQTNTSAGGIIVDNPNATTTFTSSYEGLNVLNTNQTNNNFGRISFGDAATDPSMAAIGTLMTDHTNNYGELVFWTRGAGGFAERVRIDDTGNVGIGTPNPGGLLHISGSTNTLYPRIEATANGQNSELGFIGKTAGAVAQSWDIGMNIGTTDGAFQVYDRTASLARIHVTQAGDLHVTGVNNTSANAALNVRNLSLTSILYARNDGNVGINTILPGEKLEVNGNVKATSFISTSDRRLKTDIRQSPGLESILKLEGKQYRWISSGEGDAGLIAQDVEAVFPDAVRTDPVSGYKGVKYQYLIAPLIEATKDLYGMCRARDEQLEKISRTVASISENDKKQNSEIDRLRKENQDLRERLERLERKLEQK